MRASETVHAPRFDRRSDANTQRYITILALVLSLIVNVAGIAWGAARLSSTVEQLNEIVKPLVIQVQANTNDISVIKDRYQRSKDR